MIALAAIAAFHSTGASANVPVDPLSFGPPGSGCTYEDFSSLQTDIDNHPEYFMFGLAFVSGTYAPSSQIDLPSGFELSIRHYSGDANNCSNVDPDTLPENPEVVFQRDGRLFDLSSDSELSIDGPGFVLEGTGTQTGDGGLVRLISGSTLSATGTTFRQGDASGSGGCIFASSATVDVHEGSTFEGCAADGDGGAIYAQWSTVNLHGTTLHQGDAGGGGGCMFASRGTIEVLDGSTFDECNADEDGGAINAQLATNLRLTGDALGGVVIKNSTGRDGGGIYQSQSTLELEFVDVTGNTARDGGGLMVDGQLGSTTITNSRFSGNTANDQGGAIHVHEAPLVMQGDTSTCDPSALDKERYCSELRSNSADSWGALFAIGAQSDVHLRTTVVDNNLGSAIGILDDAKAEIQQALIINHVFVPSATLTGVLVMDNNANTGDVRASTIANNSVGVEYRSTSVTGSVFDGNILDNNGGDDVIGAALLHPTYAANLFSQMSTLPAAPVGRSPNLLGVPGFLSGNDRSDYKVDASSLANLHNDDPPSASEDLDGESRPGTVNWTAGALEAAPVSGP